MKKKHRRKKRKGAWRFIRRLFLVLVLLFITAAAGLFAYVAITAEPIDPESLYSSLQVSSVIYDRNGKEIGKLHYDEDRELASSENIPVDMKNAVIAIEDKTFYSHHGFNFKRMFGAVLSKLTGRSESISGTSTITQQLARNVYLSDIKSERTIKRKATEMYYAFQLERALTKDEILTAYLNTIYLGYGCYGIDSAAMTYFSKNVSDLSLSECAALAAIPQAPDTYALLQDEEGENGVKIGSKNVYANGAVEERQALVLDLMAEQGYISQAEADDAKSNISDLVKPNLGKKKNGYTYFTDYVTGEVIKDLASTKGLTDEEALRLVYTGGLSIYTTLDADIQKIVDSEFKKDSNFPSTYDGSDPQASMVITEVGTGKILAMSGGRNASGERLFNRAVSPRQPGSSIKPLSVYAAALQKSFDLEAEGKTFPFTDYGFDRQGANYWGDYITAGSYVSDERMTVNGEVWPLNFSRTYSGRRTFRTALQQSINTCAVKIQLQVGPDYSIDMLKKFGITTVADDASQPINDINSAALALGAMTEGVTPLEMSLAYAAFPSGGTRSSAVCYTKVEDATGSVVLEKEPERVKVMDEGVAWIMTDVLKSVVSRGIAGNASISGVEVGGKTGTTNDTFDIWFCGFTPKYSAALWIGTDQNVEMSTTSSQASLLWSRIMSQIPGITEGEYKEMPGNVVRYGSEYYTSGTEPYSYTYTPRDSGSNNNSSGSSNSSSGSSESSGSQSRDDFIREFNGGGGSSGNNNSSRSGNSRDEWVKDWLDD